MYIASEYEFTAGRLSNRYQCYDRVYLFRDRTWAPTRPQGDNYEAHQECTPTALTASQPLHTIPIDAY